jgi:hypothetical protein
MQAAAAVVLATVRERLAQAVQAVVATAVCGMPTETIVVVLEARIQAVVVVVAKVNLARLVKQAEAA